MQSDDPFALTYEIVPDAPEPMSWADYESRVVEGWTTLLSSADSRTEANLQRFLELHPCMLPGAFGMIGVSGHLPFPSAVISQPRLPGLKLKFPDFMWIAGDSGHHYPVLIEIETPHKGWFTKKGTPTAALTQAINQIKEWKAWFNSNENRALFLRYYHIPKSLVELAFHPLYILIHGSRSELDIAPEEFRAKRGALEGGDEFYFTFDHLVPDANTSELMCVRITDAGYVGHTIPATLRLGPMFAGMRRMITHKEDAIARNEWITAERRDFLLNRVAYWDSWAQDVESGRVRGGIIAPPHSE